MDVQLIDIDTKITFQSLCEVCEKVQKAERKEKNGILFKYFSDCKDSNNNVNLYPIIRLLLPQFDRDRGAYGIKENTFAKIYIRILTLPSSSLDAQKLLNYKAPSSSTAISTDFADVAYWVLKSRCKPIHKDIFISDINKHLDRIAHAHGNNQPRSVDDELTKLFSTLTAMQQKWLVRMILKDLKLGMSLKRTLSCFHPDAPDLYDSSNNLAKVCSELCDLKMRLNEIEIEIYSAYRPMLSERLDIKKIKSVMKKNEIYFLEMKFDGERFQIHMKNGIFKYFSRNAFDYTQQYGESFNSNGIFTKYLKDHLDDSVHSFIIDGEMMGWHKTKKIFSSKGINFDVKKISDASVYQPCFCAFDILLYNDIILSNKPLYERLEYLDKLFKDETGVIMHSVRRQTQDSQEVVQALNDAIDNQEEGIVLKDIMSVYKPNSRKGGWFKIKPEYTDGVMNELDFLIIGGYYVENKRYGEIGSVLLGVADSSKNSDNEPIMFYSAGRVKLTLVKEEIEELCGKLKPHWNTVQKDTIPDSVSWSKDKPDVWINPKNSYILQIKASELVKTNAFKTEYTVRFPRVEKIRYDKPWYDCLTLDEFSELTKNSLGVEKLTGRNIGDDDIDSPNTVSPRKKSRLFNVASQFQSTVLSDVLETSSIFSGKEFCIINGNDKLTKSDIELRVVENGGRIVQNPGKNTFCIIAGDKNVRVMNAIKSGEHNIATVGWFLNTLKEEYVLSGKLLEWTPQDLLGMSSTIAEKFILEYDKFGDSYTVPTNRQSLEYCMNQVYETINSIELSPVEMNHLDFEIFNGINPYSFLRGCNIYFKNENENIDMNILKIELKLYGAICCESIDSQTTHIIICSIPNNNDISEIKDSMNIHKCKPVIVTIDWISYCLKNKSLVDVDEHILNIFDS